MDRRTFISGGVQRVVVISLALMATGSIARIGTSQIVAHLLDAFPYLTVSRRDLEQFAAAYRDTYGVPGIGRWAHVEEMFLLSTDFFMNGADESIPVRFVSIYHPYVSLCFNPLAVTET